MRTHLLTSGVAALLAAMPAHAQTMTDGAAKRRLGTTGRGRARTARRLAVLLLAALFPAWPLPVSAQQTPQLTPLTNPPDSMITNLSFSNLTGPAFTNFAAAMVSGSVFSGNSGSSAGAIFNRGTVTITNSSFSGNSAGVGEVFPSGGAINNFGPVTITGSSFTNNSADFGGAINTFGTVTITNSSFTNNRAGIFGGAIDNAGTVTITNSSFTNNSAGIFGGAIDNESGTINLVVTAGQVSTFSGNTAGGAANSIHFDNGGLLNVDVAGGAVVAACCASVGGTFFCPHCGALYSVTCPRFSKIGSNVAKCVVCLQTMDEWDSTEIRVYKLIQRPEDA